MSHQKTIGVLVGIILILSLISAGYGLFSGGGPGESDFTSVRGENVQLYGKGLYQNDSESIAVQAIAQDGVTLFAGIPLLAISFWLASRGNLRGKLLLAGTLGYFLYTYGSYSFLSMYNSFFIVYVGLMSVSFFAFLLTFRSIDLKLLKASFSPKTPVRTIGGFLIFFALLIAMMWLGRMYGQSQGTEGPAGLEHYSTLVIQALDLGFVVPVSILAGILFIRRTEWGYLLASVIIMKDITLATAVSAMAIGQWMTGVDVSAAEVVVFPIINLFMLVGLYLILKNVKETAALHV